MLEDLTRQVRTRASVRVRRVLIGVGRVNAEGARAFTMAAAGLASVAVLIAGCASSSRTYGSDGKAAYSINCLARTWGMCFEEAGNLCRAKG
jgi:hypothetical protein